MKSIALPMLLMACSMLNCNSPSASGEKMTTTGNPDLILINQVGYAPGAQKIALIRTVARKFEVVNIATGKSVFKGMTGQPEYWQYSGDTVRTADFSSVMTPGRYRVCIPDKNACSFDFAIGENVYTDAIKTSVKSYYLNRSGFEITPEYGGKWSRPEGHPDTIVLIDESAASGRRPAGTVISSPGGWYDAGDYNKYIVNSSITVYTLLLTCQLYPQYCDTLTLDIPEKNNELPDLIDEILFNLNWMFTMQDPNDGGVYHKLTNKEFGGFDMPDKATEPRYVVLKSTQATLDFAATMAMASRVFADSPHEQLKTLSVKCLDAANNAMRWAEAHPDIIYAEPKGFHTGAYGSPVIADEWFWARTEMALADKSPLQVDAEAMTQRNQTIQAWGDVEMLGVISLALSEDPAFAEAKKAASSVIVAFADELMSKYESSAYHVSLDFFKWGSNSDVVNQALIKILASSLTGDKKYLPSIQADIDYILGRNATGYCFITGIGSKPPMNIHHRPSGADGVEEPYPGFLVGGPNTVVMDDCRDAGIKRSTFPAKSYADNVCSYSTNEICINWNAPLFFVLGAMDAGWE